MASLSAFVEGVGVLGAGLPGWKSSRSVLAGQSAFSCAPFEVPRVEVLPAAERRRTGLAVKLAIWVGQDALSHANQDPENLPTVFSSSGGDGEVINEICAALSSPEREISPTRFHNSVHNAPAGYWGIAMRSHAPSTSLCCFDWSFSAGLMEAMAQLHTDYQRVLLMTFDAPYPEPLNSVRPIGPAFGSALLLARDKTERALGAIRLQQTKALAATRMNDGSLEAMRTANPSARALPLIAALAAAHDSEVILDYVCDSQILSAVTIC